MSAFYLTLVGLMFSGGMGRRRREPLGGSGRRKEEVVGVTGVVAFKKPFYKHREPVQ